jgi:hypothetical protein
VATSTEMMKSIRRKIMWGGVVWFIWGGSFAAGRYLDISTLRPTHDDYVFWFTFGALVGLSIFVADCTDAILTKIDERVLRR